MLKFMLVTTIAALGFFSAVGSAYAQTDENCYNSDNVGSVGLTGWAGCEGMYITDSATLRTAADEGQGTGVYQIPFGDTNYTFGDDTNNIFTGQVTTMTELFRANTNFNERIGYWDTSNVTNMSGIFSSAASFNQPIGDWDTSSVTNMNAMFSGAAAFNQPLGDWDVSSVTNMAYTFFRAAAFNRPLGDWDVTSATNMNGMFQNATLFNQDISTWNMSQFPAAPSDFSDNTALTAANTPNWGTGIVVQNFGRTLAEGGSSTFTVQLSTTPLADVIIDLTSSDASEGMLSPAQITFPAWVRTAQTVTVTAPTDNTIDGDQSYTVTVAVNTASTLDSDYRNKAPQILTAVTTDIDIAGLTLSTSTITVAEGATATFTVGLDTLPLDTVVLDLSSSSDIGEGVLSSTQITFAAGDNAAQTVTVTAPTDNTVDGDQSYTVTVAVNTASTLDAFYDAVADETLTGVTTDVDIPGLTLSTSTITVAEGATATFSVQLDTLPLDTVVLDLSSSSDASEGVLSPAQITFAAGDKAPKTVTVTAPTDNIVDGDQSYTVTVAVNTASTLDSVYDAVADETLTGVTTDVDIAGLTLSTSTITVAEGATATFTVQLDTLPLDTVVLDLSSSSDIGEGVLSPAQITFAAGDKAPKTVTVTAPPDNIVDGDQSYTVTVAVNTASTLDAFYDAVADETLTGVTTDVDIAGLTLSTSTITVAEGATATFTVQLDTLPLDTVVLDLSSSDIGEGVLSPAQITFAAGEKAPKTVTVTAPTDNIVDGDQSYTVTVAVNTASTLDSVYDAVADKTLTAVTTDVDIAGLTLSTSTITVAEGATATFTVQLDTLPLDTVVLDLSSSDIGEGVLSPAQITFAAGDKAPKTVTVTAPTDNIVDGDQSYTVTVAVNTASTVHDAYDAVADETLTAVTTDVDIAGLTLSTSTITVAEGATATFTVQLDTTPTEDVIIDLSSSSDASEGVLSPAQITFAAGDKAPKTVTVTAPPDNIVDGDQSYTVTVAVNTASTLDSVYDAVADETLTGVTTDVDIAGLTLSTSTITVAEGATATFTVQLDTTPTEDVIIDLSSSSDIGEGVLSPAQITFAAGDKAPKTVTVTAPTDNIVDGDQSYTVTVAVNTASTLDSVYDAVADETLSAVTTDVDIAGLTLSTSTITVAEGATATFTVQLDTLPLDTVVLDLSSSDIGEGVLSPAQITFAAGDKAPKTVTVTAPTDNIVDGDQSYTVTVAVNTASTVDSVYDAVADETLTAVTTDVDIAGLTLSTSTITVAEGATATFTVQLDTLPLDTVVLDLSSSDIGEGVLSPAQITFAAGDKAPKTVTVTAPPDNTVDGDQSYTVTVAVNTASTLDSVYDAVADETLSGVTTDVDIAGLTLSTSTITVAEGATATFTVQLDTLPLDTVVLDLSSSSDASEGVLSPAQITFAAGDKAPKTVTVTAPTDNTVDGDQSYTVTVAVNTASTLDSVYDAVADETLSGVTTDVDIAGLTLSTSTITVAEGATATFTVQLDTLPLDTVVLDLSSSSDIGEGVLSPAQITFAAGDKAPKTVTVTAPTDNIVDGDQSYTVTVAVNTASTLDSVYDAVADETLSGVTTDVDIAGLTLSTSTITVAEGATATFTVQLDTLPLDTVVLDLSSSSDIGEGVLSPAQITFAAGDKAPKTVTVTAPTDNIVDGDQSYTVTVAVNTASTLDSVYDAVADETLSGVTTDVDIAGLTLSTSTITVAEGATATFTVQLDTLPLDTVVLDLSSSDIGEGVLSPAQITFAAGDKAPKTVTVTAPTDNIVDGDQSYTVTVAVNTASTLDSVYDAVADETLSGVTTDVDIAALTLSTSTITVAEGATATFTVGLDTLPLDTVVLDLSSSDIGEGVLSPAQITFAAGDKAPKTVTVTAPTDNIVDGDQSYTVTVAVNTASTLDSVYDAVADKTLTAVTTDVDVAGLTLSTSTITVAEGATATFTVGLDTLPLDTVVLDLSSSDIGEGVLSPAQITFAAGDKAPKTVTVTAPTDNIVDGDQSYTVTVAVNTASTVHDAYDAVADETLSAVTTDVDIAGLTLSTSTITVAEGATATFTVQLDTLPLDTVVLDLSSSDIGEGVLSPAQITFAAGDKAPKTVTVTAPTDNIVDGDQSYTVTVAVNTASTLDSVYDAVADETLTGVTTDVDIPGLTLSTSTITVAEGATATFSVQLDTLPLDTVVLDLSSSDIGEGVLSPAQITFAAGDKAPKTVTVTAPTDNIVDGDQSYTVTVAVNTASTLDSVYDAVADETLTGVTTDVDIAGLTLSTSTITVAEGATATFTVQLDTLPLDTVVLDLSSSDIGEGVLSPAQITFAAGDKAPKTVTVTAPTDNIVDGDQSYTVTVAVNTASTVHDAYDAVADETLTAVTTDVDIAGLTLSTSTITVAEGATATFSVQLDTLPLDTVVLDLSSSSDIGEGVLSPAQITFAAGDKAPKTVTVTAPTDNIVDGDQSYTVTVAVNTASTVHDAYDAVADETLTGVTTDVDIAGLTLSTSTITVAEGATATFTVQLDTLPLDTVVLDLSSSDIGEGVLSTTQITFAAGDKAPKTVTVTAPTDNIVDGDQSYTVTVAVNTASTLDSVYDAVADETLTGVTTDVDIPGLTLSTSTITVAEGATATFSVQLDTLPLDTVVLDLSSSDIGEGVLSPAQITFAAGDKAPKTVTVTAPTDNIVDGDQSYTVTVAVNTASTLDSVYDAVADETLTAVTTDVDIPGLTLSTSTITVAEGATATFTVGLDTLPLDTVVLDLSSSDIGEGVLSPAQITFAAGDKAPKTVTVTAPTDNIVDGDQSYTVTVAVNTASTVHDAYDAVADETLSAVTTDVDNDAPGVILTNSAGATLSTGTGMTVTEGENGYFLAKLLSQPSSNVVLSVTSGDLAISGVSTSTSSSFGPSVNLTFTDTNWNINQTVFVEGTEETSVDITVNNSTTMTIAVDASTADEDYKDTQYADNTNQDFPVAVTNNDTPLVLVDTSSLTAINEAATSNFTIALANAPLADVTVTVTSDDDGIATLSMNADASGAAASQTVTFTPSNYAAQTVYVNGVDNQMDDGNRTVNLTVANSSASGDADDYNNIAPVDATATSTSRAKIAVQVDDDDTAGQTIPTTSLTVSEAGATSAFTVVLTSQPTDTVTYEITVANGFATTSVSRLTFNTDAGVWNTVQTVTVSGIDNSIDEQTDNTDTITLTRSSSDANYSATTTQISVTNIDNDQSGVTASTSVSVTEGAAANYTVALAAAPTADVTVRLSTSTQLSISPASMTFTSANWNTAQTMTVTAVDNSIKDGARSVTTTLTATSSDNSFNATSFNVTVAISDDGDTASKISAASSTGAIGTGTAGNMVTVSYLDASGVTQTATTTVASEGTWSMSFVPVASNGSAMTIMDTDTAANVSTTVSTSGKVVDATPPTLTVDSDNSTTKLVKGTGDAGETIVVSYTDKGGNAATATTTVAADGTWSITLDPAAKSNTAVTVTSTDANGNTATVTIASIASADIDAVEIQQDIEEVMVASGEMVITTVPSVSIFINAGSTDILSAPTSVGETRGDTQANIKASDGSFAANLVTEGLRLSLNTTDSKTSAHIHTNDFKLGYDKGVGTLKASFTTQQMHVEIDETAAKTKLKLDARLTPTRTKADRAGTINGWVSGELLRSEGSGNKMDLFVGRVGAHKFHDTDSLTGLMLTTDSGTGTFAADGFTTDNIVKVRSYMIGVYHGQKMQTAAGNSYNIEAQLHFGTSKMDLTTPAGDTASTNGSRILATGRMSSNTTLGEYKLEPFIQGNYFSQKNDGFSTAQNNTVVAVTRVSFADVALGAKFNYAQANGMTIGFEPSLVYRAKASGAGLNIDERTMRGRVSMDLDMPLQSAGGRLITNVYLDGIGIASSRTYGASIKFERQF